MVSRTWRSLTVLIMHLLFCWAKEMERSRQRSITSIHLGVHQLPSPPRILEATVALIWQLRMTLGGPGNSVSVLLNSPLEEDLPSPLGVLHRAVWFAACTALSMKVFRWEQPGLAAIQAMLVYEQTGLSKV
jgi:hypothetical protein